MKSIPIAVGEKVKLCPNKGLADYYGSVVAIGESGKDTIIVVKLSPKAETGA